MISKSWKKIKVSDLGKIITGKTPPTKKNEYWGGTIPFLTPSDNMDQKHIITTRRYITDKAVKDFNNNILPSETICVSCIGSDLGKVVKTKVKLMTNQQINSIIPHDGFDNDFIYYRMILLGKKLNYLSKTSTAVPIINKTTFSNFSIKVPNIVMQKEISKTLSLLDDKIELNNKININLEELSQTLYKHWFVDFEFPNEDGHPYKSSGGKMIDSEIGMIPEGWDVFSLNEYLEFERGIEPGSKNYNNNNIENSLPFIRVGDLNSYKPVYVEQEYLKEKTVYVNDVLVSFDGAIGRVAIGLEGSYSTGLRKIYSNGNLYFPTNYIYYLFKSDSIQNTINSHANGTTILHAGSSINFLKTSYNEEIVKLYSKTIDPIFNKIIKTKKENDMLESLRDSLLPKLMTGEIRVPVVKE